MWSVGATNTSASSQFYYYSRQSYYYLYYYFWYYYFGEEKEEVAAEEEDLKSYLELYILEQWRIFVVIWVVYLLCGWIAWRRKRGVAPGNWKRVLLVIAHPDDECMFFGPTLVEVVRRGGKVYVVCLSCGEQGGTGDVRKRELFAACSALGVPQADVVVYRCCDLADGPHNSWSPLLVARLVSHHAHVRSADVLLTFDRYGVSYHENHVSAWRGVVLAVRNALCPEHSQAYALETVNILRKYSVFFDCFLSRCTSNIIFIASLDDHSKIVKAMSTGHPSQYIWFRRLFMYFSRYAYINTYKRIIGK